MEKESRTLIELYELILQEKATFSDYTEFIERLLLSSIGPDNYLKWLKEKRKGDVVWNSI